VSGVDIVKMLCLGLIWGTSFLFIKVGVTEIPPAMIGAGRLGIAAILVYLVLRSRGIKLPGPSTNKDYKRLWRDIAIVGFFNNAIPFVLIPWGEQYITSSLASILNATMPIFTILVAHFMTRDDRFTIGKVAGVVLGFIGVVVLIGPDLTDLRQAQAQGELAIIIASISYAVASVYARERLRGQQPIAMAGGQLMAGFLWTLPIALATAHFTAVPSWQAIGSVVVLGLMCTGIAYILFYSLLMKNNASLVSMVTYINPFTAVLWGALLLHEALGAATFGGLVLICIGISLANGTLKLALRWAGARLGFQHS
jgi:drug/metabolite transporter (DMT)-like permease